MIEEYIQVLKEIKELNKKEKLELTENVVIALLQEYGKDKRVPKRYQESTGSDNFSGEEDEATEKQLAFMRKLNLDIPEEGLTKNEAKQLISEAVEKQEKGKKRKNAESEY